MKSKLYQFAILFHPVQTQAQKDTGVSAKTILVKEPTSILAADDKQAGMLAARAIPEEYTDKLDQIELAITPF